MTTTNPLQVITGVCHLRLATSILSRPVVPTAPRRLLFQQSIGRGAPGGKYAVQIRTADGAHLRYCSVRVFRAEYMIDSSSDYQETSQA